MASKDQAIGALIFLVCVIVAIGYIVVLVAPQYASQILLGDPARWVRLQFWAVAIVVLIAFLAIMFIGAWIGWTMATTPPPKPIEELEAEETKAEKEKAETEEPAKTEEKKEPETATETKLEETKKKRKK